MPELSPGTQPAAPRSLGQRTLLVMWLEWTSRIWAWKILLIALVLLIGSFWLNYLNVKAIVFSIGYFLAGAALALLAAAFSWAWIWYKNWHFTLGEDAIELSYGILSKKTVIVPYSHIQSIDITQTPRDRILGVVRVMINTAEHERPGSIDEIFPPIEPTLAQEIKSHILSKSENVNEQL